MTLCFNILNTNNCKFIGQKYWECNSGNMEIVLVHVALYL